MTEKFNRVYHEYNKNRQEIEKLDADISTPCENCGGILEVKHYDREDRIYCARCGIQHTKCLDCGMVVINQKLCKKCEVARSALIKEFENNKFFCGDKFHCVSGKNPHMGCFPCRSMGVMTIA